MTVAAHGSDPHSADSQHADAQHALVAEGDRLARHLAQTLPGTLHDGTRLVLLGRSLAVNLVNAFVPTVEQVTRLAGQPLHARLALDERERPVILIDARGESRESLPVDDLLTALLYARGRLHPVVATELTDALSGDEHHATQALIRCLRSKPVLNAMQTQIRRLMTGR